MSCRVVLVGAFVAVLSGCAAAPGPTDPGPPREFKTTESGLRYRVLRDSERQRPGPADNVRVHYRGWLDDGTEFDSSYARGNPASFNLGQVVKGWTEGLQLVGEGGMIELEVPADLGYGKAGQGDSIPPDATLHFIVEVIEIVQSEG